MSSFLQDVRIAVRGYLAKPLFSNVVLAILCWRSAPTARSSAG